MTKNMPFLDTLRSEYDPELFDIGMREKNAKRLFRALNFADIWQSNMRILDIGSGTGMLLAFLGSDARLRIACDLRRELFLQARSQTKDVSFAQSDGCLLPFPDEYFELVTCLAVIGEFPDWQSAMEEMGRCVAPKGILYVTVANGRFLSRIYAIVGKVGFNVRESWRAYATACTRITDFKPENGMGILNMKDWRFINLTPYLVQSQWPWLKIIPMPILSFIANLFAPSYGYAWRKLES